MKRILFVFCALPVMFLAACSSDGHSLVTPEDVAGTQVSSSSVTIDDILDILNKNSSSSNTSANPNNTSKEPGSEDDDALSEDNGETSKTRIRYSKCDSDMDETVLAALELTNTKAASMFRAFFDKNVEEGKSIGAEVKPMYRVILDQYPQSCGAQVGYAMASIVNVMNNPNVNRLYNVYEEYLPGMQSVSEFVEMANRLSDGTTGFTKRTQNTLEKEVVPVIDSAIAYMRNVVAHEGYELNLIDGGVVRQLDKSEFSLALGALYGAKAAINLAVSVNLEIKYNGGYEWISQLDNLKFNGERLNKKQTEAVDALVNLIGVNGTISSIYSDKKNTWKSIPALVDSALAQARASFEYSLSEFISDTQENDVYVVGYGSDADISVERVNEVISNLKKGLDMIRGSVQTQVGEATLVVNFPKFFENTSGFEKYLPYYEFEDTSDLSTFYFTDENMKRTASLESFANDRLDFKRDGRSYIVFPDPSFGGIFPEFKTQDDFWDFVESI